MKLRDQVRELANTYRAILVFTSTFTSERARDHIDYLNLVEGASRSQLREMKSKLERAVEDFDRGYREPPETSRVSQSEIMADL